MIKIDVSADVRAATRLLDDVQKKQIPFAAAVALTKTAKVAEDDLLRAMVSEFDNPSPYTRRATYSTSASKLTLTAEVGLKDKGQRVPPSVLLREHFTGGVRGGKPMEVALRAIGALPAGWRAIPGEGLELDGYGNPKRALVREVIGALKTGMNIHKKRIKFGVGQFTTTAGYFVASPSNSRTAHLTPGVYRRYGQDGRAIKPVFIFVRQAAYRKVIDLPAIARKSVGRVFVPMFERALDRALSSAR